MVKRAMEIKSKKGILEEPDPKKGKSLSAEVIERVIAFYQSDYYMYLSELMGNGTEMSAASQFKGMSS